MTTYAIIPIGGAKAKGCAFLTHNVFVSTLFQVGDFAYIASDALNWGKLNKICIKKVYVNDKSQSSYWIQSNGLRYKDTFNGVWKENELVSYTNALSLVAQYQSNRDYTLSNLNPCTSQFRF